jgi:AcrR family transcriptional regulator
VKGQGTYHHGDLKQALIDAGIHIMEAEGADGLSLRRVAAACGVSQAAPYAHFKDKGALVDGIKDHITQELMGALSSSLDGKDPLDDDTLLDFGEAYISFFIDHRAYFRFVFQTPYLKIRVSLERSDGNFPPYELFRTFYLGLLRKWGVPDEAMLPCLVSAWGIVQGVAMLATSENIDYPGDWKGDLRAILSNGAASDAQLGKVGNSGGQHPVAGYGAHA